MRSSWARETFGGLTLTVAFVCRTVFSSGSAMSLPRDRRVVVRLVCFAIHTSAVDLELPENVRKRQRQIQSPYRLSMTSSPLSDGCVFGSS
jgi:hypothetical protein